MHQVNWGFMTYLIKTKTLSMKALRFSGVLAMSEYFPDPSFHPPMAIVTLSFGCFCLKPMTFLYWPACNNKTVLQKLRSQLKAVYITSATSFFCIKETVQTIYWICDIIQAGKCIDYVRAQHRVNIFNSKSTISWSVCRPSCYIANNNFVVGVDIWKKGQIAQHS